MEERMRSIQQEGDTELSSFGPSRIWSTVAVRKLMANA